MRIKIRDKILVLFDLIPLKRFVVGLQSNSFTPNGQNCLFLDFDDMPLKEVKEECRRIMNAYDLPNIYIYQSSKKERVLRYNCFCFTPLDYNTWLKILWDSKCDFHYKTIGTAEKRSTLRFTRKKGKDSIPKLVETLYRKSKTREEIPIALFVLEKLLKQEREFYDKD